MSTDTITAQRTLPDALTGIVQWVARPQRSGGGQDVGGVIDFFGELGLMKCPGELELGICVFRRRPLELDRMECHYGSAEILYAVDDDFIAVAAPGGPDGKSPRLSDLAAFHVRRGEGLLFDKGCWHWAPFTFGEESFALVGFARGTSTKDMTILPLGRTITIREDGARGRR
jgi:hypothetical protein